MRISRPWYDFEKQIMIAPEDVKEEILLSAALKKKGEIEYNEDVELDDSFVINLMKQVKKKRYSPEQQMKFIKRFVFETE
jgi:hypothetical protein